MAASQKGDPESFRKLIELHQKEVYQLAFGLTQRADTADDITQETFISAWRNLERIRKPAAFQNWLVRIAINKTRSYHRWRKLRNLLSLESRPYDEDERAWADILPDLARGADPAEAVEDLHFYKELLASFQDLPSRQREILILRTQGMELLEIASALGLAEGTVKAHLFAAKQKLRQRLPK